MEVKVLWKCGEGVDGNFRLATAGETLMGADGGNRQSGIQRPGDPAKRITFELTSQLLSYGFCSHILLWRQELIQLEL